MNFISKIVLIFLLFGSLYAQQYNWQSFRNSPVAGRFDDISFVDENTGWAINSSGEIYKTNDGALSWVKLFQSNAYLRSVGFANDSVGWVGTIGTETPLYLTADGGITWQLIENLPEPKPLRICGISVVDDTTMFACGAFDGPGIFIKTFDRGKTWTSKNLAPLAGTLVDCFFLDKQRGFVVGGNTKQFNALIEPVVLYTEDGGETWEKRYEGSSNGWCWKINFPTEDVGYISVENFESASVLKTIDGGLTWRRLNIPGNYDIQGVGFLNENVGWVGGYGETSFTKDGGLTWENGNFGSRINRFRFINDSVAYASGETIYKFSRTEVTSVQKTDTQNDNYYLQQNYPNPFNLSTTIRYNLPEAGNVKIRIFNSLGQNVNVLVNKYQTLGNKSITWNGENSKGELVNSGVYIYRIDTEKFSESRVMVLVK